MHATKTLHVLPFESTHDGMKQSMPRLSSPSELLLKVEEKNYLEEDEAENIERENVSKVKITCEKVQELVPADKKRQMKR